MGAKAGKYDEHNAGRGNNGRVLYEQVIQDRARGANAEYDRIHGPARVIRLQPEKPQPSASAREFFHSPAKPDQHRKKHREPPELKLEADRARLRELEWEIAPYFWADATPKFPELKAPWEG